MLPFLVSAMDFHQENERVSNTYYGETGNTVENYKTKF